MHSTPFDFDVITGPSIPRDDREDAPQQESADEPQASAPPAQPRSR